MEEYLTVMELSQRIKLARQTIYNLIYKNVFILNQHYLKPTPKKVLFKWSAILAWMEGKIDSGECPAAEISPGEKLPAEKVNKLSNQQNCLINI